MTVAPPGFFVKKGFSIAANYSSNKSTDMFIQMLIKQEVATVTEV